MPHSLFIFLLICWAAAGFAADDSTVKSPSPDGRFALRIAGPGVDEYAKRKVDVIEKKTGKVAIDLDDVYPSHLGDTVLVWSADSKWAAFGTRGDKEGDASVFYWDGSAFVNVPLPDNIPDPKIKFGKGADGDVKNYGGAVKPVRWLKSGELQLSNDWMVLSRINDKSYTGTVLFTVGFDAQHHATVHKVGKTKTEVD